MSLKPLSGIRVLDFTRFYAGPYCTMLLGDLGADVVKIDQPGGDPTRHQGPPFLAKQSMAFLAANRNKRSIEMDLGGEEGQALARKLAAKADVIVENFRPAVMKRWGLDYETLSATNPGIVYLSISGMGADGPSSHRGGFDLTAQAEGGYMSITGQRGGTPMKLGTSAFDLVCAQYGANAVTAALLLRTRTGKGQRLETSLFESEITFLVDAAVEYFVTGNIRGKWGSEHSHQTPYGAYEASDGWMVIAAGVQNLFELFCKTVNRPDLMADPRFSTHGARLAHRDEINAEVQAIASTWKVADLVEVLDKAGIPCAPVNNVKQVFEHPQAIHRGMRADLTHPTYGPVSVVGPAVKYGAFTITDGWKAPPLSGEHTDEVLNEWLGSTRSA
jgi:succinate--hydroxymethylglutarate CoA-transferase